MRNGKLTPAHGICAYIVLVLFLLFGGLLIPAGAAKYSGGIAQVFIFLFAITPVIIAKVPFNEVFPIKIPLARQVCAVFMFFIGAFFINTCVNTVLTYFVSFSIIERNAEVAKSLEAVPFALGFVFFAVMPAISEEALCRGLMQHSFAGIKNKWLLFITVGFLFGAAHLNVLYLPGTMLLGIALGFLMYETKNIVIPFLFHFINNSVAIAASSAVSITEIAEELDNITISSAEMTAGIGIYLALSGMSPFLFYFGQRLLKPKNDAPPITAKPIVICSVIAVLLIIPGVMLFGRGALEMLREAALY